MVKKVRTLPDKDGYEYIFSTLDLRQYLNNRYGSGQQFPNTSKIGKRNGVIISEPAPPTIGHTDVWVDGEIDNPFLGSEHLKAGWCAFGAIFERPGRMAAPDTTDSVQGGLSDEEKRDNVIRLAFGGDPARLREFCRVVEEVIPPGTTVVLRGSSLTGWRWDRTQPFDGEGPGTSDLDLTLVGDGPLAFFKATGFFVPGVHSRPLSDEDPDIAPDLVPLRQRLMAMVGRPVNIQASREIVIQVRGDLIGQPYLELFRKPEGLSLNGPPSA